METQTMHQSLSMYGMFMDSDLFMKALILGLLFASIWCWTIIFDKIRYFKKIRNAMKDFETKFWSGGSLENLYTTYAKTTTNPLANISEKPEILRMGPTKLEIYRVKVSRSR